MAEYDLDGLVRRATDHTFAVLPPFDTLMKLSAYDMVRTIIVAAAPVIEDGFRMWLIDELAEAGVYVDAGVLSEYFAAHNDRRPDG